MSLKGTLVDVAAVTTDRPPVLDDRAMFGHPRGLALLFVVEMWERFSYYGMRALLVLYLVNALNWSDGDAARLYGAYTGLVYLTPLIGGYLADRLIGTRRSLVIGGVIIALGHFALAFGPGAVEGEIALKDTAGLLPFYLGLALVVIGTGFFKPNVSTMVGQVYREGDPRRDSGFTIFYMGINLGAFLAPLVCGYLGQRVGWHYGFGAAGVGMVLGLIIYMWGRDRYLPGIGIHARHDPSNAAAVAAESIEEPWNPWAVLISATVGAGLVFLGAGDIHPVDLTIRMAIAGMGVAAAVLAISGTRGEERNRVIALFIVVFFVIFFWMAFEQAGSSMNLFADRHTNLNVGGFEMPSSWFQSMGPLFILIFAPVFAILWTVLERRGNEPSTALKMVLGLVLLGVGFLFLVVAGRSVDRGMQVSAMWLTMAYLFHTLGELCLSPVGLSYVTKVAPYKFASLLMGAWFLANAAANYLGGFLAAQTETVTSQARFFSIPVATSFGAAFLLLLLVPLLKRLTRSVKA
ncbi:MAG TPA: peptide MFS transporter [Gemmatimonadaceae bacterium]|nr:peptide MFS transporter [Gemmatimonadaceae bacterium]